MKRDVRARNAAGRTGRRRRAMRRSLWVLLLTLATALLLMPAATSLPQTALAEAQAPAQRTLFRQHVPGLLVRVAYEAETDGPLHVAIWDLLIGARRTSEATALPGAAILTVRSGAGSLIIDGERSDVRIGMSVAAPEGAKIVFDNARGELELALRAVLVTQR